MPVTVKNISEVLGKDVFTTKGVYAGRVADLEMQLDKFRIKSLIIEAAKGSFLASMVGGKRGVIIPYQLVESVGDVVIIKHIVAPAAPESTQMPMEEPVEF
jgi:sporulation protein YlmC with PRC-barrel domain